MIATSTLLTPHDGPTPSPSAGRLSFGATDGAADACVPRRFEAAARLRPEAPAAVFPGGVLAYGELNAHANRLARSLRARGVGPDARVAVLMERGPELPVALLAVLKAGGAYVPVDPAYPDERIRWLLDDSGAVLVLTHARAAHRVPAGGVESLDVHLECDLLERTDASDLPDAPHPESLAYVIYTSGSTGRPKGVGISHRALASHNGAAAGLYGLGLADRVAQVASLGFDISVEEIFPTWATGGTVVFRPDEIGPAAFTRWIADERVTVLNLPTAFWHAWVDELAASGAALPPSLRLVVVGGEKAQAPAFAAWRRMAGERVRWINSYGPTEATVTATAYEAGADEAGEIAIGYPLDHADAYVLDDGLHIHAEGELFLGGDGVARGYLGRPALTAERFLPDPFASVPGVRMYRTGDRVRTRADGALEFLGRVDDQVKVGGYRVEPGEVEAVLAGHPAVAAAAVAAREGRAGMRLVAYAVPRAGASIDPPAVRGWLRERLPAFMVPSAVVVLDALPLTANGKVDRAALPAPAESAAPVDYATPTEELVAEAWDEVLGTGRVGPDEDFFDLGGHSLLAMQVLSRLRQRLGVELPVRALFEAPTVARLAARVDAARAESTAALPPLRPAPREGRIPLSFAQQRLWFLHQMEPESPFYNIPFAVRLNGTLDTGALANALCEVIRRHEALRTTFGADGGGSFQVIHPAPDTFSLPLADLRAFPRAWAEGEVLRLMADEAEAPFDLRRGLMLRAMLIRLAETEHVLFLNLHHVAGDGWSIGLVFRELAALYGASRAGQPSPLPDPPVQYADFARWQREWLRADALEGQLAFWRERLAGAPAVLELPTDRPRPAVQSHRGEVRAFHVDRVLTARLRELARGTDATLFMVLLAAFDLLVARLSGRDDVVVGSPIAGRVRREVEGLIGFFVNTMALRTDLSGDPTFRALVRRVRETTLEAYAHQDLPFERVVEELQPQRTLSHNPLFQVCFALQNVAMDPVEIPGLTLRLEDVDSGTSKFDLFLEMVEQDGGLRGNLEYATDLFEPATIDRLIRLFLQLLEGVAVDPDLPVSRTGGMDPGERRTVVERWNWTARPYPRESTIHGEFAAVAEAGPDRVALAWDGGEMSYGELHARSSRIANHLRALGVRPDEPVALLAERGPELVAGVLGILKAGGCYVPVNPRYPAPRISLMLHDCCTRVVLAAGDRADVLPADGPRIVWLDAAEIDRAPSGDPRVDAGPDAAAYVVYTSGSTGRPKGVVVPHRAVLRLVRNADYADFGADQVWLQLAPMSFDASTLEVWGPLLNGGRLALYPPELPSVEALGEFIGRHGVTSAWLTAGLFHQVVDAAPGALAGLRQLLAGGDVLSVPHVRRVLEAQPELRLVNGYGPTENTTFSCCHHVLAEDAERASIPIGRPIANSTAYVLDGNLAPVPPDVPGELYVGGDGLARGYLGAAALTADRYVPDPFGAPGARLYRTGDRVRWRPDGTLEFLGRMDQQVKLRGFRIEPGEIENVLERHERVSAAVVDVREDAPGDRRLVAYVVPARPEPADDVAPEPEAEEGQVRQWETLFDDVYHESRGTDEGGDTFDIIGWNSSYTGQPIPADEMREWVEATVARILETAREQGTGKGEQRAPAVLELGVGTGLLFFRVAPSAREYLGTDLSAQVLAKLQGRMRTAGIDLPPVTLLQREAADFAGIEARRYDTAILNSVCQYFPSAAYFGRVVERAMDALADGGAFFVGDVRSRPTLEAFRTAVELDSAPDTLPLRELRHRARRVVDEEEELVVDPDFFHALASRLPRIGRVEVRIKRGRFHNELTRHRYDVVLRAGDAGARTPAPALEWDRDGVSMDAVRRQLDHGAPLAVLGVPDARLAREMAIVAMARDADASATVADARRALAADPPAAIDPEAVWALGDALGLAVDIRPTPGIPGRFDALFRAPGDASADFPAHPAPDRPLAAYTNDPAWAGEVRELGATLRAYLKEQLPEHMVPSAVVPIDALPLTPNGKVDRRALPAPQAVRREDEGAQAEPRTEVEKQLAAIWAEVLRLERVWVDDNFFDLGGHSLLATQLVTRVRDAFHIQLPLQRIFEAPTVAALASVVEEAQVEAMAVLLDDLDQLTDEQVRALLEAEQAMHGV